MYSYESLDYDVPANALYRRDRMGTDQAQNSRVNLARWWVFGIVGVITGTVAFGLAKAVEFLTELKFSNVHPLTWSNSLPAAFGVYLGFDLAYVAVAAALTAFVEPVAAGSGIPQIKGYLNGTNYARFLRSPTLLVKCVGVVFAVGAGLAIGKEGPLVHTGAVVAANVSHCTGCARFSRRGSWLRGWTHRFRNDKDKRDFVSGGAAAGVAAAFGAPVGGILFSLEEASSFWSTQLTWMVFMCSVLGTFFLNIWKIIEDPSSNYSGLISFAPAIKDPFRVWELPFFLILGLFGGLQGALFNTVNERICHWRREHLAGKPLLKWTEAMLVALSTAVLTFWAPYVFSECRPIIGDASKEFLSRYNCADGEYNTMASILFAPWEQVIKGFFHNEEQYDMGALLGFFVVIFFLAVITYGISVPSGLFVPCILMGCAYGRLMGEAIRMLFPDAGVVPGTYAIIGATASLGGVARMTISLAVILTETTNDITFVTPTMLVLLVSKWVGDLFGIALYDLHVELQCMPFVESKPSGNMFASTAQDVMAHPVRMLTETPPVKDVVRMLQTCRHNGFPVVSTAQPHRYVGMIMRNQLVVMLKHRAFGPTAAQRLHVDDFATTLSSKTQSTDGVADLAPEDLAAYLDLRPIMNPVPIAVQRQCPLSRVFTLFRSLGIRHLVVTDDANEPVGIISRKEIMSSYDQDLF